MIREKLKEWNRIIRLSRKPGRTEFIMIAKITGLGMVLIGAIGFLIRMILEITGIDL
ncbi:MAG: protein translocase SEC61 complex subunit gamma [Candidatus Hydrothermarchaeaceae archaeon]